MGSPRTNPRTRHRRVVEDLQAHERRVTVGRNAQHRVAAARACRAILAERAALGGRRAEVVVGSGTRRFVASSTPAPRADDPRPARTATEQAIQRDRRRGDEQRDEHVLDPHRRRGARRDPGSRAGAGTAATRPACRACSQTKLPRPSTTVRARTRTTTAAARRAEAAPSGRNEEHDEPGEQQQSGKDRRLDRVVGRRAAGRCSARRTWAAGAGRSSASAARRSRARRRRRSCCRRAARCRRRAPTRVRSNWMRGTMNGRQYDDRDRGPRPSA